REFFQAAQKSRPSIGTVATRNGHCHCEAIAHRGHGLRRRLALASRRFAARRGIEKGAGPAQRATNQTRPSTHRTRPPRRTTCNGGRAGIAGLVCTPETKTPAPPNCLLPLQIVV